MNKLRFFFSSRKSWTLPYLLFSLFFVIIPMVLIVVYAFTDDAGHLTLANFSKFLAHREYLCVFDWYCHSHYDRVYCVGLSGGMDSESEQFGVCQDGDYAVYPAHVGEYPDPYAGYGGSV